MKATLLAALLLASLAQAQISVTRIKRQLETSKPQEIQLDLRRGETVAFDLQFLSYGTVMDISGSTVTLHATTNGMLTGTSFQISGTAGSNGTASVRISVDEWLPYQLTSGTWTLECALPTASRIMRASGVLKLSGLYYPSTNSPLPVSWSTNFWTAISAIQTRTNDWNTAYGWGDHAAAGYLASSAWLAWLSTNQYVRAADTNGWTVSPHQAWLTNQQSSVTLTNFTASGYFKVPDGMIHMFPGAGEFGTAYRHFGFDNGTFLFYDYSSFPDLYLYKFVIDPRDSSITYGSGLSAERWLFPAEGRTNTIASKSWVAAYVTTNSGSSGVGNVESVFGRTGIVVAVSGDYTAEQVGAYPANNPSNLTTLAAVRSMTHSNQMWYAEGTNATYQLSWDTTNGTFKVLEILP